MEAKIDLIKMNRALVSEYVEYNNLEKFRPDNTMVLYLWAERNVDLFLDLDWLKKQAQLKSNICIAWFSF